MLYRKIISSTAFRASVVAGMLIVALWSCEKRYDPEIDRRYEEILVIDGMITNRPGPYTVLLSSASSVQSPEFSPLSGYQVVISDDSGNAETLTESDPGEYFTSPGGITGVAGRNYRLEIATPQGKRYLSNYEKLKPAVHLDSVYAETEYMSVPDYPFGLPGYRFYLNATHIPDDSTYLLWRLTETWKYKSDFKVYFTYDGILHEVINRDTLRTCYKTEQIPGVYLFNMVSYAEPQVKRLPLHLVTTDTRRLSIRYSLLVEQLNISESAYTYWAQINELQSQTGDLYSKLPFQVRGNIYNADDPEEAVFGFFMAASVDSKRIFTDPPPPPVKMYYPTCELVEGDFINYAYMFYRKPPPPDDPYYITQSVNGGRALTLQSCLDCRLKGGVIEKPDFWID